MRVGRRVGRVTSIALFIILGAPSAAHALTITVPSATNLGTVTAGTTSITHQLGAVTVDTFLVPLSWTATVTATNFTTGTGPSTVTIPKASIRYSPGAVTASSGVAVRTPGAPSQSLSGVVPVTAYTAVAVVSSSTTWNPTIVIAIPTASVAGTYTGTITHSVA